MRGFARPISALGSFRIAAADIERAPAEEEAVALRPSGAAGGTPSHFQQGVPDVRMIHSRYVASRLQHGPEDFEAQTTDGGKERAEIEEPDIAAAPTQKN